MTLTTERAKMLSNKMLRAFVRVGGPDAAIAAAELARRQ